MSANIHIGGYIFFLKVSFFYIILDRRLRKKYMEDTLEINQDQVLFLICMF